MLHAFFRKLAQHRSHSLVAPVRSEDEGLVCVGKLQHGGLTKLQLELLECLHLFAPPLPYCILLQQLVEGMGDGTKIKYELPIVREGSQGSTQAVKVGWCWQVSNCCQLLLPWLWGIGRDAMTKEIDVVCSKNTLSRVDFKALKISLKCWMCCEVENTMLYRTLILC